MTITELKDKICFRVTTDKKNDITTISAQLALFSEVKMSRYAFDTAAVDVIEEAKEAAREAILRELYEDKRSAMWEALSAFQKVNPADQRALAEAQHKLRESVRYLSIPADFDPLKATTRELARRYGEDSPDPVKWNPGNKVVQDHRDGTIYHDATNAVRALLRLPVPWTPGVDANVTGEHHFNYVR